MNTAARSAEIGQRSNEGCMRIGDACVAPRPVHDDVTWNCNPTSCVYIVWNVVGLGISEMAQGGDRDEVQAISNKALRPSAFARKPAAQKPSREQRADYSKATNDPKFAGLHQRRARQAGCAHRSLALRVTLIMTSLMSHQPRTSPNNIGH